MPSLLSGRTIVQQGGEMHGSQVFGVRGSCGNVCVSVGDNIVPQEKLLLVLG